MRLKNAVHNPIVKPPSSCIPINSKFPDLSIPVVLSKIPLEIMAQNPHSPWTYVVSNGSSISVLMSNFLVLQYMRLPINPITQLSQSWTLLQPAEMLTNPATTELLSSHMLQFWVKPFFARSSSRPTMLRHQVITVWVRPLVAEAITVFITIAFGVVQADSSISKPPAPPLMNRPVIRINRLPVTTKVWFVGWD